MGHHLEAPPATSDPGWLDVHPPTGICLQQSGYLVLSVALALEYEAVCRDPEQRIASGLSEAEVETIVTALCAVAEPVETRFLWRPQLHDPADEMVLDAAINGAADILVTFNRRDFGQAPARFGIALLSPQEALRRLSP